MNKRRELYEILSRHRPHRRADEEEPSSGVLEPDTGQEVAEADAPGASVASSSARSGTPGAPADADPAGPPAPARAEGPSPQTGSAGAGRRSRAADPSAIVLDVEAALLIFLVAAVMMYTAYHLGRRSGERDMTARIRARMEAEARDLAVGDGPGAVAVGVGEHRREAPTLRADACVLRLASHEKTPRGLSRARDEQAWAAARPAVREEGYRAFVLEGDGAYMVAVGPLEDPNGAAAEALMQAFRPLAGPPTITGRGAAPYAGAYTETLGRLGRVVE